MTTPEHDHDHDDISHKWMSVPDAQQIRERYAALDEYAKMKWCRELPDPYLFYLRRIVQPDLTPGKDEPISRYLRGVQTAHAPWKMNRFLIKVPLVKKFVYAGIRKAAGI